MSQHEDREQAAALARRLGWTHTAATPSGPGGSRSIIGRGPGMDPVLLALETTAAQVGPARVQQAATWADEVGAGSACLLVWGTVGRKALAAASAGVEREVCRLGDAAERCRHTPPRGTRWTHLGGPGTGR